MNVIENIFNWFYIAAIGLVALAFLVVLISVVLTFLVAMWEKQYVETFTPLGPEDRLEANSYYTVMNQLAPSVGYVSCGEYWANRKGPLSRVRAAFWLSPDGLTAAVVAGGKVARMRYRKSFLFSQLRSGEVYLTMDDFGVADLSGTRNTRVVLNADFVELARVHAARILLRSDVTEPFSREQLLLQMNQIETERVRCLVSAGYGRYLDPQQSVWRHTIRGAWTMTIAGFFRGIQQAKDQSDRQHLNRPGG